MILPSRLERRVYAGQGFCDGHQFDIKRRTMWTFGFALEEELVVFKDWGVKGECGCGESFSV
jgi:Fe-S cluster assembly iron-binding protein IscA